MNYAKLQQLAHSMGEEEKRDTLVSLLGDARFAAVVKLLEEHREGYVAAVCQQRMAGSDGALQHAAGSIYALETLGGVLKQLAAPVKQRGEQKPKLK